MGGRAGTGEEIHNQIIGFCGYAEYALNQADGFWSIESGLSAKYILNFFAGFVSMPYFFMRPPSPRNNTFNF